MPIQGTRNRWALATSLALAVLAISPACLATSPPAEAASFSGVYPHLAYWNQEAECGTGAVVPWANRLWVTTYGPHLPRGSSDKLYEIDSSLQMTIRPESTGGTHANRMIHKESNQLFIGPYVIDAQRNVRVIPHQQMPGRLTGNARHLKEPSNKIYFATMEEGFYEVDVQSLEVTELYPDANDLPDRAGTLLPGYHGKGLHSGQGRLVYSNNGERSDEAKRRPDVPSGCLAEWIGGAWHVVRRMQYAEVSGPGGIEGNANPESDPIWSIGWDHKSLVLMLLDNNVWHSYRLPKASHCYDGAHGWNTEWPRIRDIGEPDLLMTMHGAWWRFPRTFSRANSSGLAQRRSYLKVIGDFCRWQDNLVFGADDSAKHEFLNKRKAKGTLPGPGISHSNLWFVKPHALGETGGPARGNGAVWWDEPTTAGLPSDSFLFAGFDRRALHLAHDEESTVTFALEVDRHGNDNWTRLRDHVVAPGQALWVPFLADDTGAWVRITPDTSCQRATAMFTASNRDQRTTQPDSIFTGLLRTDESQGVMGLVHAGGTDRPILRFASTGNDADGNTYELDADLTLRPTTASLQHLRTELAVPENVLEGDAASLIFIDDAGRRFRIPRGNLALDQPTSITTPLRICREVVTERDLFHAHGTFYELPAENAGGFALIRPVATHPFRISDYCSWRGMLVLAGISTDRPLNNDHIIQSDDGFAAVWLGVIDDLWRLGKATGRGGPWCETSVTANEPSDPYLCNGFDRKQITLSHDLDREVTFTIESDFSGRLTWRPFVQVAVPANEVVMFEFPVEFEAYWLRLIADHDCHATALLAYD